MLKNFILLILIGFANVVLAQSSSVDSCVSNLKYYFLAGADEAKIICGKDSSDRFLTCMKNNRKASTGRPVLVVEAADKCANGRFRMPLEVQGSTTYTNFKSCDARMQIYARLPQDHAMEVCDTNPSAALQKCYVALVQSAGWHPAHSVQYCNFANQYYPKHMTKFISCVIQEAPSRKPVESIAQTCHEKIIYKPKSIKILPDVKIAPMTPVEPFEVRKPAQKQTGADNVPTPVQIHVQQSAKPEVINDQPLNPGSTSNSESLPLD